MSGFSDIDLSQLPAPAVLEELSAEQIQSEILAEYQAKNPKHTALVESDPLFKLIEVFTYRELLLRQRVNDAARQVLLAYATGSDLDQLAALVPMQRKIEDPGDPDVYPPIPVLLEDDANFRRRVQLAPEGFSTAGPDGAYIFHAIAVNGVRDASVSSPKPGEVLVHILASDGDGTPSPELVKTVNSALNARETRPLTDQVIVKPAELISYSVNAVLHVRPGPSAEEVESAARETLKSAVAQAHVLGAGMPLSKIYAALQVEGVARVELTSPAADVACTASQAALCTAQNVSVQRG
ncbi:baseplate J/gp47 family protein [Desulfobaculum bizertense]|uniref:baseplate assembly protein n=1 Tax=Desulfobaculum bizertense TaxID=376490 RepID=UPI001F37F79C|nr:baseplate J/gp47 family protein [Desulfobaculum bizertense]UIJ38729.1 baseplate J/gp47 family protein [Desulfobaculum bizertense]